MPLLPNLPPETRLNIGFCWLAGCRRLAVHAPSLAFSNARRGSGASRGELRRHLGHAHRMVRNAIGGGAAGIVGVGEAAGPIG
jgi:hypothetical protein